MKRLILVISGLAFFLTFCKKEDTNPSPPLASNQIVPLKIGNKWELKLIDYIAHDTTYSTNSIISDTLIGLEHWYIEEFENSSNMIATKNMNDGLYFYYNSIHAGELAYKYPAQVNDRYFSSYYNDSLIVLSIDSTITVQGGTFNCYQYFEYSIVNPYSSIIYVSPGIGFIKSEFYINNVLNSSTELINYQLY